jgi:hypothetical protein
MTIKKLLESIEIILSDLNLKTFVRESKTCALHLPTLGMDLVVYPAFSYVGKTEKKPGNTDEN